MNRRFGRERGRSTLRTAIARRVRLDARTLAVFRVGLGLVVLLDLLLRARYLVTFYTDRGVLPTSALAEFFPGYRFLSVHAISGSVTVQVLLFSLAAVVALALVVGYRTRVATVLSLVLLVSLQARNPMVLNGGDPLLRRLLFWSVFLPLGARWSVDAEQRGPSQNAVTSVASAGLCLQVLFVYLANLGFKLRSDAWLSGRAVRQVLELDDFVVLFGDVLAGFPTVLVAANWLWLGLLAASPLLLVLTGRPRATLAAAFVAMHAGMFLTMRLGLFPVISIVALLPFFGGVLADATLPAWADRARTRLADVLPEGGPGPLPSSVGGLLPRPASGMLVLALVVMVLLNAVALGYVPAPAGTPEAATERSWDMFAPSPPTTDVRFVAPATLDSGRPIDAFRWEPPRPDPPPDAVGPYPTARWHKYLSELRGMAPGPREELAAHLCWRWNRAHADEMVRLELAAVETPATIGDGGTVREYGAEPSGATSSPATARRIDLGDFRCRP